MNFTNIKASINSKSQSKYLLLLSLLLTLKAIWAIVEISTGYIGLDPDEAQYWTWSQNLAFGFYSKPPGIAWQIWLGCKLFGNTELGVRSFAVLISTLTSLAVYFGAWRANFSARIAFWAAIIFTFSPIGMLGAFAATTDGGFILFWTLATYPILEALEKDEAPNYLLVSLFILCGALFKWPIYLLWVPIIVMSLYYKSLYNKALWSGMALSLMGLLPSIVWNSAHNWPTFRHAFIQTTTTASKSNFWEFFGAQFAVLSPIFFIMLMLGLLEILRLRKTVKKSLVFCTLTTTLILGAFLALSSTKKIQANWALYAYPTSTYIIAWYGLEKINQGIKWLYRGVALSLFMVFILVSIPFIQKYSFLPEKLTPFSINPFRRSMGWQQLKTAFNEVEYNCSENFLFSDSYQLTSLLSFYGPDLKRQYFFNTNNRRKNQFCFWPTMADEKLGKTGYYVWTKKSKDFVQDVDNEVNVVNSKLAPYFEHIELVKTVPLYTVHNKVVKGALIFKCKNYNGKIPKESTDY
ncbi:MAG: hypothetical protein S4CHLAM6_05320 [Chlamydiae bacterium]|nr:hypothetical protein [Chlamydiota bacterium]